MSDNRLTLKKCYLHFNTIVQHKKEVFRLCRIAGLTWQGLVHDLSKFTPTEFIESATYYQGDKSPILAVRDDKGFSEGWLHHKGRNKHHWEYWLDKQSVGGVPIQMPYKYVTEMACDMISASKTYNKEKFNTMMPYEYFMRTENEYIHKNTRAYLESVLKLYGIYGDNALKKKYTKRLYNAIAGV